MLDIFTGKSLDEALSIISTDEFKHEFLLWCNSLKEKTSCDVSFFYLSLLLLSQEYPIDMIEIHHPAHTFERFTSLISLCHNSLKSLKDNGEPEFFEYYYPKFVELMEEYIKRSRHHKVISQYFADYMLGKQARRLSSGEILVLLVADIEILKEYKATFSQLESADLQTLIDTVCVHCRLPLVDNMSQVKPTFDQVVKLQADPVLEEYYELLTDSYYQNPCCTDKTFIYLTLLTIEYFIPSYKIKLGSYQLLNSGPLDKVIPPLKEVEYKDSNGESTH